MYKNRVCKILLSKCLDRMKKQGKPKSMILRILPKAVSAVRVSFQNPPFSPGKDKRAACASKGLSCPIISIIPDEARRKSKSGTLETPEPTSPKVSCMGQIKHKKNIRKLAAKANLKPVSVPLPHQSSSPTQGKKQASKLRRVFSLAKSDAPSSNKKDLPDMNRAPGLVEMKRFASGRDAFASFDWTAQIAPLEADHVHRDYNYYSDDERRDGDFEEEEEVMIPFSAPMRIGCEGLPLRPRKEINIWKRRTTNPPPPLQLKSL
ncbi:uncharacterized protein At1g76070-like [Gossypium arboreum]|uniref:Syringolide-induced protein 14-1-1 n=1 Tax=Gossypium arboreum TaxID=29729 RepID=A0ABR0Q075_GOSAR|nr:uncharacterized protein At1g76070-like [Gossypium arboreum]KAK5832444.1 hypothetical protein PVK06_016246 [Gossypium arboreum]